MNVTARAVMSSTLAKPVCGGGKLVGLRSEVGSEIIISQHLAELSFRLLALAQFVMLSIS